MRYLFRLLLVATLVSGPLLAAPSADLLGQLLKIAEPDQIQAYHQLQLTPGQRDKLQALALSYRPKVRELQGEPARLLILVPEALSRADKILTAKQRPLLRKLLPRRHQWKPLRELYASRKP